MLEVYCKLKTKPKTIAEVKEALQVIWGNLSYGPIDKVVNSEGLRWSLELVVDPSNIHSDNEILASKLLVDCVVSTMLLNSCCSLNIFNAEKSVNGHVNKSITSSILNKITFYSAVRCRRF